MWTSAITPELIANSVIAVPPLARDSQRRVSAVENAKIIRAIENGGVSTLLYGGNAVFYHLRLAEYAETLSMLAQSAAANTWIVPSVGPTFGLMMDHADVLKDFDFPTVMILPQKEIADEQGIATGVRLFVEQYGKPIVLYIKHDRWLAPALVESLHRDGLISWIKYAVVRDDPSVDPYLREILSVVPANIVVSGIGEQPAIIHLRDFGVGGFTSGCVCVSPARSMSMLRAIRAEDYDKAESIRKTFVPLEDLRNAIQPIRVLHHAVGVSGIAQTGPMQPLLGELNTSQKSAIELAVKGLIALDRTENL